MRVLAACSLGGAGHLQPMLPFLDAARRRGDEVLVVGPPALADMVTETGHAYRAGGEPDAAVVAGIRERLPTLSRGEAAVLGNVELFGRLATDAMLPVVEATCAEWAPDLILRDPTEYASAIVAVRRGVRRAQVAISVADAEAGAVAMVAPILEAHAEGAGAALEHDGYLTRFPASMDPSPFPVTVRYRDERPAPAGAPPAWRSDAGPTAYLSLGTVLGHMDRATAVFKVALRAVAGVDVRVLLTVGRRVDPAELLGAIPANVHVERWIDQAEVLPWVDLVVCHGGSGTLYGALAAGRPVVAMPLFADQFENGRRAAAAGAAVTVEVGGADGAARRVLDESDAPRIADAIRAVIDEPGYTAAAHRIAAEMAASPTAAEVLDQLLPPG